MPSLIAGAFGILFIVWGMFRMNREDSFIAKSKAGSNIIGLMLSGQASGLGQFLSGIVFIVIAIVAFFIK